MVNWILDIATDEEFNNILPEYNGKLINAIPFSVTGLVTDNFYYCRVKKNDNSSSEYSYLPAILTSLTTPILNNYFDITSDSFSVEWSLVNGATGYVLDISTGIVFSDFVDGYQNKVFNETSGVITGLVGDKDYYTRVKAVSLNNYSLYSIISGTTESPLQPPVVNNATNITLTSFNISWSTVLTATSYMVDVSNDNFATNLASYNNLEVFGTTLSVTGLVLNTEYKVRVRSNDGVTITSNSNVVSVTTSNEYILYSSNESGQYQIYIIKPDGTGKTNISNDNTKEDRNPQYSGVLDAFVFERKIGSYYQICKKDRVSGTVTQLTSASAHSYVPAISPDGTKISFIRGTKVYIINASDGSAIVDFTPSVYPLSTNRCNFNSTSDKVLVVETAFPNYQGNLYNMSGVKDSGSVLTPIGLQFPAYSKDYTKLIMRTSVAGSNHIYKANADGSSLTQMTTTGTAKQQCAYSNDGLSFVYIENYTGAIKKALVSAPDTATQIVSSTYSNDLGDWIAI